MQSALDYIHILLFFLWLGGDVGVFVCILSARNPASDFKRRYAFVLAARRINILSRVCFAFVLITGLELAQRLNLYPMDPEVMAGWWALGVFWAVVAVVIGVRGRNPLPEVLRKIQIATFVLMGLVLTVIGLNSLATGAPLTDTWFAVKVLLFGLIFWAVVAADLCFRPFWPAFVETGDQGESPEREETISRAIDSTLTILVIIFVLVVVIVYLGQARPF